MNRLGRAGLYAGGFLGPFAGAVTAGILPEIGADFGRSAGAAAATVTFYLLPFAGFLLVSGTLGARWGARRTVIGAYVVYALASVLCATAWAFPVLLAGRAIQGVANAFITPILLAALAATTPKNRLGRTLGLFSSLQALGQTSAPLVGGLAAEIDWRWAFVGSAVVATTLITIGVPPTEKRERPTLRSAWTPEILRTAATGMVAWSCLGGLSFLVAFRLGDAFGLGAGERGMLLTGAGVVGMITARMIGKAIDRIGARRCVLIGTSVGAVLMAGIGTVPNVVVVALLWACAGACTQAVLVGLNTHVLTANTNRAGAVSVVQSLRFLGGSVSPLAFVPLYHVAPWLGFVAPALALLLVPPAVLQHDQSRQDVEPGLDVEQAGEPERHDGR